MKLYQNLSSISFLKKSYAFKFLFVAFIGIHIPLIGILFYVLFVQENASPISILIWALVLTLLATGITLLVLKRLIFPIELASRSLLNYQKKRAIPLLPVDYQDEAGLLMRHILEMIQSNEKFLNEKQDMLYLLSHDLKTFTANSQSLSQLIIEENAPEPIPKYAQLIHEATTQQLNFIHGFIKLLKIQDELLSIEPKRQLISLTELNDKLAVQVSQQTQLKKIRLTSELLVKEYALMISTDLLLRVLVNLVDNALKFSHPEGEINLVYQVKDDQLLISVQDHGLGFELKTPGVLFEKFTAEKKMGTANEYPTGLGLYLCKTIVEKHKGRIDAVSPGHNQGATFTVVF